MMSSLPIEEPIGSIYLYSTDPEAVGGKPFPEHPRMRFALSVNSKLEGEEKIRAWDTLHDYDESLQRFLTAQRPDYGTLIDQTHDSDGRSKWNKMTQQCLEQWKSGDTVPVGAIGGKIDIQIKDAKDDAVRSVPSTPFSERPHNGRFHFTTGEVSESPRVRSRREADEQRDMLESVKGSVVVFYTLESGGHLVWDPHFLSNRRYSDADVRDIRKAMLRHKYQVTEQYAQQSSFQGDPEVPDLESMQKKVKQISEALRICHEKSGYALKDCTMTYAHGSQLESKTKSHRKFYKEAGGTFIELGTRKPEQIWADIPADTSSADALEEDNPFSDKNASGLGSEADASEEGDPFSDGHRRSTIPGADSGTQGYDTSPTSGQPQDPFADSYAYNSGDEESKT